MNCRRLQSIITAALILFLGHLFSPVRGQVAIHGLSRGPNAVNLDWLGGHGPYIVEASPELSTWSALGDPVHGTTVTLPAYADDSTYRLIDLDPDDRHGNLLGLVQTDQGEFGGLLGRHRLKTRLWLYTTQSHPHTAPTFTAAEYFRKLIAVRQYVEADRIRTWTGPLESLGTVATPTTTRMTLRWSDGTGRDQRTFTLTLEFPYSHAATRTEAPLASDPSYELRATYTSPQPEFDYDGTGLIISRNITAESTALYQLDPNNGTSPFPAPRRYTVRDGGAEISLHFQEGLPLLEGSPPWIWKTFILDRWLSPSSASGASLPAFTTNSWFARTLKPGHHNFVECVLLDPALDPALSEATRAALRQANIRYIYTFKDLDIGVGTDEIRYVGFDHTLRDP
ncbi:MAG: hypothetical protein ACKV19_06465 [Verrucomicrobiales bacterium]